MSIENQHGDAELARFLRGEDELSSALKALPQPAPSAELDALILGQIEAALNAEKVQVEAHEAANDAVDPALANTAPKKRFLHSWWQVPLGLAAGILLTITFRSYHQSGETPEAVALATQPKNEVSAPPPAFVLTAPPQDRAAPPAKSAAEPVPSESRAIAPPVPEVQTPGFSAAAPAYAPAPASPVEPIPPKPLSPGAIGVPPTVAARTARHDGDGTQTVTVTGVRMPQSQSLSQKREAAAQIETITAEDLAKMPDIKETDRARRATDKSLVAAAESAGTTAAWTRDVRENGGERTGNRDKANNRSLDEAESAKAKAVVQDTHQADNLVASAAPAPANLPVASAYAPPPAPMVARGSVARNAASAPVASAPAPAPAPSASAGFSNRVIEPKTTPDALGGLAPVEVLPKSSAAGNSEKPTGQLEASAWLVVIEQKLTTHDEKGALEEWGKFRKIYPEFPVNDLLAAKMKALQDSSAEPSAKPPLKRQK